jgi:L-lactate dehydrogenase complex protein LldG
MTTAGDRRETIIAKIRMRLGTYDSAGRRATVARRLAEPAQPLVPERAKKQADERRVQLRTFLEGQSAIFVEVAGAADVPAAIAGFLRSTNLPLRVRVGDDAYLRSLDWQREPALERMSGPAQGDDEVGLSHAAAAVAETGTLVMASGPDNPVTLNFLPETHIVVLAAKDVVGDYEAAWAKLRAHYGRGVLPRTVNMITGPSRSGDIEQIIALGVHGPIAVELVVLLGA